MDEDQKKAIQSYDPQAPVTRKGVLRSLRTGRPIEIREEDMVGVFLIYLSCHTKLRVYIRLDLHEFFIAKVFL